MVSAPISGHLWTLFNTSNEMLLIKGKTRGKQDRYQPLFLHSNKEGQKVPKLPWKIY